ncbi:MAG: phosphatidate cytidylyltransferase [Proteobacteria bacterium]|nr:phosphatidate cytidylyltransferase [Pseudomonadota bacterium]
MRQPDQPSGAEPVHPQPPSPIPPSPKRRSGNELALRLATAAVLVPGVLWLIVAGPGYVLIAVVGIVLLGIREFYHLIEAKGAHPLWGFGLAAGAALPVVAYLGNEYHATILMTAVLLAVMVAQVGKAQITEALASISGTFFGVFYVGWLLTHAVTLRNFHRVVESKWGAGAGSLFDLNAGAFLLIFTLSAVVLCDAGAYFAGRAWGKRKLAPKISPGKTVEGALGGIAAGTLAALLCKAIFDLQWPDLSRGLPWALAVPIALVLTTAGMIGDLVESLLKRDAAQKDAGSLLPGMGGVLDRIDSALLAIPVMYYLMLATTYLRAGFR